MGRPRKSNLHLPPRLQKKGKSYYYTPVVDRKVLWEPLGPDYAQALVAWQEREGQGQGGASVSQLIESALAVKVSPTGGRNYRKLSPRTVEEMIRAANRLKEAFAGFRPQDVTPQQIAIFLETSQSPIAANREIEYFSSFWETGRRRGWVNLPNPCTGVAKNPEIPRDRVAEPEEIERLLRGPEGRMTDSGRRMPIMLRLALMTAIRLEDVVGLRVTDITEAGLRVRPEKTVQRTGETLLFDRSEPEFDRVLRDALALPRYGSPYVFPVTHGELKGQAFNPRTFVQQWRRYFKACGVEGLTWHDLRRTAINLRNEEHGLQAAQKLAGHGSITTTERYLRRLKVTKIAANAMPAKPLGPPKEGNGLAVATG